MTFKQGRVLSLSKLSPSILRAEYAVRGEIAIESEKLRQQLCKDNSSLPFKSILSCNLGNPQALKQTPISFYRKVVSLMESFDALGGTSNEKKISELFGTEVYKRVLYYSSKLKTSIGAYSQSQGHPFIRSLVASFIDRRDTSSTAVAEPNNNINNEITNVNSYTRIPPCNPDHIFLTNGASSAIHFVLSLIIENSSVGVLIPEPQYPLYSATISLLNGVPIFYPLVEPNERFGKWGFSIETLKASLQSARSKGVDVRALCIINPGNPTGNVLSCIELKEVIQFCWEEHLVLLSDEVYQSNIWDEEVEFCSARKALYSYPCNKDYPVLAEEVELFSFHSTSKGFLGECGKRGGYVECTNIDHEVLAQLYKLVSISLCSNIDGQLMVGLMADPPVPRNDDDNADDVNSSDEYNSYVQEIETIKGFLLFFFFKVH